MKFHAHALEFGRPVQNLMKDAGVFGQALVKTEPYALLAPHYDHLLGGFRKPFERLRGRFLKRLYKGKPGVFCDLACGTGTHCMQLAWRGWDVIGVDGSEPMLDMARKKLAGLRQAPAAILEFLAPQDRLELRRLTRARKAHLRLEQPLNVSFIHAAMDNFRLPQPANVMTCLFDSLNHLPNRSQLLPVLREVRRNLKPGGLFLCDCNSVRAIRKVWPATRTELHEDPDGQWLAVSRGGPTDVKTLRSRYLWTWFVKQKDGRYVRSDECYRETAWNKTELQRAFRSAGLSILEFSDCAEHDKGFERGWRHWIVASAH